MTGWSKSNWVRRAMVVAGVSSLHLAAIAALATHQFANPIDLELSTVDVVFADIATPLEPPSPPPEPKREPQPQPEPELEPERETEPLATPEPRSNMDAPLPEILTQSDPEPAAPGAAAPSAAEAGHAATEHPILPATAADLAAVLKQTECLKLQRRDVDDCPPTDPFVAAAARAARALPEVFDRADPRPAISNVDEQFFNRAADARLHWPDADLFSGPMAPGAYNAQRIRQGLEPLWSDEMKEGFRKKGE
ncbi:MAG: hypothetical protein AAGA72_11880 [Pseudomonadota bacterium]